MLHGLLLDQQAVLRVRELTLERGYEALNEDARLALGLLGAAYESQQWWG